MRRSFLFLIGFTLLISGCGEVSTPEVFSTLTIAPPDNPYQSSTRTPEPSSPTPMVPTAEPLIPTATPVIHAVQPGDTLFGIAIQYNISLDALVSANPGIDTSLLSIGTELVIPPSEEDQGGVPTPTPYPLTVQPSSCYPTEDDGTWCYLIIENDHKITIENITTAINIYSENEELVQSVVAIPPLNLLFPGQSIPAGAFLGYTLPEGTGIDGSLLTALPADVSEPGVEIIDYSIQYSLDNQIAQVSGTFEITNPEFNDQQVWIAGIGFSDQKIAGVRKWISSEDLTPGTPTPFLFQIYSLGPRINRVQLLIELH